MRAPIRSNFGSFYLDIAELRRLPIWRAGIFLRFAEPAMLELTALSA
jgi:hypothetical protein